MRRILSTVNHMNWCHTGIMIKNTQDPYTLSGQKL
jgi:hypothetical protein